MRFSLGDWLRASPFYHGLKCLSGGSLSRLVRRAGRVRRLAGEMVAASAKPGLPLRLQIEITDVCNLGCRMCAREFLSDMNTGSLATDRFVTLVDAVEPYYVTLNGLGEPLLDRDVFVKLAHLHARGVMTAMPTNGTVLRQQRLEQLARYMPNVLTFSLDGARAESYEAIRLRGNFSKIIQNYRVLAERFRRGETRPGSIIRALTVLQRDNLDDYRSMYQLLREMGLLRQYALVPLFDFSPDPLAAPHPHLPTPEALASFWQRIDRDIEAATCAEEREFYRRWRDTAAGWQRQSGTDQTVGRAAAAPCIVPWYSAYIDAKGRVLPCCYLVNTDHVMGRLDEKSFPEIWHGATYQTFRRRLAWERAALPGCATCPRNDTGLLRLLRRLRLFL
ncbi:MAG: radical SAM protein [Magnetococcales bacterium]|nr:radical SAM protein [Magnetococcales bacterium]